MEIEKWCPLFGDLPDCTERDGITENCIKIITDARDIFLTSENIPGPQKPAFDSWIKSIWLLCRDSYAITFDAQWRTGLYSSNDGKNAWTSGREESFLTFDVDQVSGKRMVDEIRTRAGIDDDLKRKITPVQAFALMAIGEAWKSIRYLNGKERDGKRLATDFLMRAEKLMKAALASQGKETQAALDVAVHKATRGKAQGGINSGKVKQATTKQRNAEWNARAAELRKNHNDWSKSSIAEQIAKETGGKMNTIRLIIKISPRKP